MSEPGSKHQFTDAELAQMVRDALQRKVTQDAKLIAKLIAAVEAWHEYCDCCNGLPQKDHEVKLLCAAVLIAALKSDLLKSE